MNYELLPIQAHEAFVMVLCVCRCGDSVDD